MGLEISCWFWDLCLGFFVWVWRLGLALALGLGVPEQPFDQDPPSVACLLVRAARAASGFWGFQQKFESVPACDTTLKPHTL